MFKSNTTKARATAAKVVEEPKSKKVVLTQEDFDLDPSLAGQGYVVGQEVEVEAEDADEDIQAAVAENAPEEPKKVSKSVDIIKSGVEFIRTYSEGVHGKDFMALAKEFVSGHPNTAIVDSASIKRLIVNYKATDKKTGITFTNNQMFTSKEEAVKFRNQHAGAYIRFA